MVDDLQVARKFISKRDNALQRGLEFSLSLRGMGNLLRAKKCYYTGIPLTEPKAGVPLRASDRTIDRVDASKGYIAGNVVACCHAANHLKSLCEGGGVEGIKMGEKVFSKTLRRLSK